MGKFVSSELEAHTRFPFSSNHYILHFVMGTQDS